MLNLFRTVWPLPASIPSLSGVIIGIVALACAGLPELRADDKTEEEEPEKLIGLLDPSLAKPLMTLAEEKRFGQTKERTYTTSALKSLSPSNKDEELIQEGVRYRVHRLTIPENWPNIGNCTKDLVNDLEVFADNAPRAREYALKTAVAELESLLFSDQPKFVKINAAWLLGRLNIQNINRRTNTPAVPYSPAAGPLIKLLEDSQQGLDVKVPAVRGVSRILADGDPSRKLRDQIARALATELDRIEDYTSGPGRDWYQWALVDALGKVDFPRSMTQQTYVVDALWKTMHDQSLPWHIRTRAARSLGQIKLDATFNVHLLAHELVLMTGQMAADYNQNPNLSFWPLAFSDLYFAFKAKDSRQQQRGWGLMQNPPPAARPVIEGAYQQMLPLVNAVLGNVPPQPVPPKLFSPVSEWLKANPPPDRKIHAQAAPLAPMNANPPQQDSKVARPADEKSIAGP